MREQLKQFWFRLKIFGAYIVTEPFRQLKEIVKFVWLIIRELNKKLTWVYLSLTFASVGFFYKNKLVVGFMMLTALVMLLLWEWESGNFMHWHRQKIRKRIERTLKEKEENKL